MTINQDFEIVPYAQLGGLTKNEPGHGIFIDRDGHRLSVGSITVLSNGEILLNIQILREMLVSDYRLCELSKCYDTFEAAVAAAGTFLTANRQAGAGTREIDQPGSV
jgi:hypothetical protein